MRKRTPILVGLFLVVFVVGPLVAPVAFLVYGPRIEDYWRRRPFDAALWQRNRGYDSDLRTRMVNDLLRRFRFQGMTREQVIALLGEPDDQGGSNPRVMVYWLRPQPDMFAADSELLEFLFDEQMKVRSAGLTYD